jgi:hypothetical protein
MEGHTMTDTAKPIPEPVCEVGEDFTELVTIAEIGIVARLLKADPVTEIERQGPQQWEAMARLGWVLDRRRDPSVSFDVWSGLTLPELLAAVGIPMGDTPEDREARAVARDQADAVDPTVPAPA